MVTTRTTEHSNLPLTLLSEDERLFRDSVYEFVDGEIRPHVRQMDETAHISRELIARLFDVGVMGIEVPESFGGVGASVFHAVVSVYALSRDDPSIGALVCVVITRIINATT